MKSEQKSVSTIGSIIVFLVLLNVIVVRQGYTTDEKWYWILAVTLPFLLLAILNMPQKNKKLKCPKENFIDRQNQPGESKLITKVVGDY